MYAYVCSCVGVEVALIRRVVVSADGCEWVGETVSFVQLGGCVGGWMDGLLWLACWPGV